jgi:glycosyltransferase involved in cell wall biosynthesis
LKILKNFLVYTTLTSWNEPPRSRHQVTNEIKKNGIVYFVEKSRIGVPRISVTKAEAQVFIITPYHPIDYRVRYRTPGLNERYHLWLLQKIKTLNIDFEIVFTFDHTSHLITSFYKNVIYYCGDDFIGNAKISLPWINAFHRKIERKLSASAKLCVVTSDYLYERHIGYNKNTHVVPLGSPAIEQPFHYKPPEGKIPTLGVVSYLNRRMALDVFDELLKKFRVVLIGPADAEIKERYAANSNAVFMGIKSGSELYACLEDVDVCIAPYNVQNVNKGGTPNKMWLYLALGKPCVVTNIPAIKNWTFEDKLVYICNNEQFLETCEKAFAENTEELARKRVALAKQNTWDNRVQQILDLYYKQPVEHLV